MSSKPDDTTSEIPSVLNDTKNNTKYQRLRFFGKVNIHYYYFFILQFQLHRSIVNNRTAYRSAK